MSDEILDSLSSIQREAVEYCDGPSLIIAGAGSGKTRVLTYKIAYLLRCGYEPWSILALTFTNKAANEMKERIGSIVGSESARRLWMGTFHSVFLRILRTEHEHIGFSPNFTIYDTSDSKSIVKDVIKRMDLDDKVYKPSAVLSRISSAKNQLISPEEYASNPAYYQADLRAKMPAIRDIYTSYCNRCKQSDVMDFDDLLVFTYKLFESHPEVLEKYADRFRYVLVDEYQDTNYAQHKIVLQLTQKRQKVCVVGDDAQSIYSFRGAKIDNILNFSKLYSNSKLFKLEQNYRSTRTIVSAANSLIHKNFNQIHKNVFSEKEVGDKISVYEAYSDVEEGQIVVRKISGIRTRENASYSDFAVLYRTNAQSRIFEEALRKNAIPYKIYGGLSFYQRKEIKDVIAYFRLSINPNDEEAFKRVINYPARGIGKTTLDKIISAAAYHNTSLWAVLNDPLSYGIDFSKSTYTKLSAFRDMILSFTEDAQLKDASELGKDIVKRSGIITDIYQDSSPENLSRQENLEELMNGLDDFCLSRKEEGNQNIYIADYLSEVSLLSDIETDNNDDSDKITLMTIHSAKGLEFPNVFIVGMEENLFPSQMAGSSPAEMEEERRLFYVALTRAEKRCFLTYSKSRFRYGKMEFGNPSRFIKDIAPEYLDTSMCKNRFSAPQQDREIEIPWKRSSNIFNQNTNSREHVRSHIIDNYSRKEPEFRVQNKLDRSFKPVNNVIVKNNAHTPTSFSQAEGLAVGKHIEHERFGIGIVEKIEGVGENCKATVNFRHAGTKQLLLKFARFTVID